jgi:hypothetical protein
MKKISCVELVEKINLSHSEDFFCPIITVGWNTHKKETCFAFGTESTEGGVSLPLLALLNERGGWPKFIGTGLC